MTSTSQPRTYGGWRAARSAGIGPLDGRQTIVVFTAILVPIFIGFIGGIGLTVYLLPVTMVVGVLAIARRDGVLIVDSARAWARWRWAEWRTHTTYTASVFTPVGRPWHLPGVLAATRLLDVDDPGRGRTAVVWNQRTGQMSATLMLSPAGALLADTDDVNRRVAGWGALLAGLADDATIRHAAVTVELVPEPGTQLADHVHERLDPASPTLARAVMGELVATAPRTSAQVRTRLTVTCDPSVGAATSRQVPDAIAELLRTLGGLALSAAGAEIMTRASASDMIRLVHTAYDPASEAVSEGWSDLRWHEAGPIHAREGYEVYRHDGGYSVSWVLQELPRQQVTHDVLLRLLSPGRHRRRVTLAYRTLPREVAARLLEREVNAAATREELARRSRRNATARDRADATRAARAAAEEAAGAGLVQVSLYVTVTCSGRSQLAEACREVEQAAGHSRLRLRRAYGGQAAAFAVGLGCGVYPGDG
ncbi:SCO6880 family protein (plasmid) [Streptosporangium sp. CA-135522]|uniref:SCO6880 family protein n=1 Tax=Streptosporangium sp. CA-135522 TaxID=3240072 RepID=UPI003D8CC3CF